VKKAIATKLDRGLRKRSAQATVRKGRTDTSNSCERAESDRRKSQKRVLSALGMASMRGLAVAWTLEMPQRTPERLNFLFVGVFLALSELQGLEHFFHVVESLSQRVDDLVDFIDRLLNGSRRCGLTWPNGFGRRGRLVNRFGWRRLGKGGIFEHRLFPLRHIGRCGRIEGWLSLDRNARLICKAGFRCICA